MASEKLYRNTLRPCQTKVHFPTRKPTISSYESQPDFWQRYRQMDLLRPTGFFSAKNYL